MLATLSAVFALLAVLLSATGLYGVVAQWMAERRRELGVHLALGAAPTAVVGAVLRRGLRLALWGLAAGLPLAYAAARLAEGMLFGVSPVSPATWGLCALLFLGAAMLALLPAVRGALRMNPVDVLRVD
jgi:ABC-type antimicrobial peptide transport system permease subunit